jgi:hypothetical protein
MMGAVSLVTFITGGVGVGALVAAWAFVWAESSGTKGKSKITMKKMIKFIVKNST